MRFFLFIIAIFQFSVSAQEGELEDIFNIKIEVASAFEESELEAASTVSVLLNDDWDKYSQKRTLQMMYFVPGLYPSTRFGRYTLGVRGFSSGDTFRKYATIIDDIPLNSYLLGGATIGGRDSFNADLLSRVEIIRGAASHLYGSSAMLGVVSMKTFNPIDDKSEFTMGGGSFGFHRLAAKTKYSFSEKLKLVFGVGSRGEDNAKVEHPYIEPVSNQSKVYIEERKWQKDSLFSKILWKDFEFSYYFTRFQFRNFPAAGSSATGVPAVSTVTPSRSDMVKVSSKHSLFEEDDLKFIAVTRRHYGNSQRPSVGTGSFADNSSGTKSESHEKSKYFELQFKGHTENRKGRWLTSISHQKFEVIDFSVALKPTFSLMEESPTGTKRKLTSIVANYDHYFFDTKLKSTLGLRVDDYSDVNSRLSPRVGVIYFLSNDSSVKYLFSSAFRAPDSQSLNGLVGFNVSENKQLDPETLNSHEFSWVYSANKYRLTSTLFYNELKKAIITTRIPTGFKAVNDDDSLDSSGLEIDYSFQLNNYKVNLSSSYIFKLASLAFPKFTSSWQVSKTFLNEKVTLSLSGYHLINGYEGKVSFANYYENKKISANIFNLNSIYTLSKNCSAFFAINNIFNEEDSLSTSLDVQGGEVIPGIAFSSGIKIAL